MGGLVGHVTASISLTAEAAPRKHTLQPKIPLLRGTRSVAVWERRFALYWVELGSVCGVWGLFLSRLILWGNLGFLRREWERCARALTGLSLCEEQTGEFNGLKFWKNTPFCFLGYDLTTNCRLEPSFVVKQITHTVACNSVEQLQKRDLTVFFNRHFF